MSFANRSKAHAAAWAETGGRCFYCGTEKATHRDHKLARQRGGDNTAGNSALACQTCNFRKGVRTVDEFRIYLMIADGRPPEPFYGEAPRQPRTWLIPYGKPWKKPTYRLMSPTERRAKLAAAQHRRMAGENEIGRRIAAHLGRE